MSGLLLCIVQVIPPPDTALVNSPGLSLYAWHAFTSLSFGFLNIPASPIFFLICLLIFKTSTSRYFYLLTGLSYYCFYTFFYYGQSWHFGYLFIFLIALLWLETSASKDNSPGLPKTVILTALLVSLLSFGIYYYCLDYKFPYSHSREVAGYLIKSGLDRNFIVGDPDYAMVPISVYLHKSIYYPKSHRQGTFVVWNKSSGIYGADNVLSLITVKKQLSDQPIIFISNYKLASVYASHEIREFSSYSIWPDEKYYLYSF